MLERFDVVDNQGAIVNQRPINRTLSPELADCMKGCFAQSACMQFTYDRVSGTCDLFDIASNQTQTNLKKIMGKRKSKLCSALINRIEEPDLL